MAVVAGAWDVDGHVFDDGHVFGAGAGAQSGEVIVEDDVEHPMQAVFDAPLGAGRRRRKPAHRAWPSRDSSGVGWDAAVAFDAAFDHGDHGEVGEGRLVGIAAVGEQPVDIVADQMAALFDAAMVGIDSDVGRRGDAGRRIGEEGDDAVVGGREVGFERQQIVGAAADDGLGDRGLGAHGIDGDEGAGQFEAIEQPGDRLDLFGLVVDRFLAQKPAAAG